MPHIENDRVLLNADASNTAFRAGQLLESLLLDRGLQSARSSNATVVTVETIEACINDSLVEELRQRLNEQPDHESRRVA